MPNSGSARRCGEGQALTEEKSIRQLPTCAKRVFFSASALRSSARDPAPFSGHYPIPCPAFAAPHNPEMPLIASQPESEGWTTRGHLKAAFCPHLDLPFGT